MEYTEAVEKLYQYYGTDSGVLFGIPPQYQPSIVAVVKAVMTILATEEDSGASQE